MKRLYLDCGMGAAGDMLAAALYELLDDKEKKEFISVMSSISPDNVAVSVRPETKCGILGTHFDVVINGEEEHSHDHHEHTHTHGHTHEHEHPHTHAHEHVHTHEHMHNGELHTHEHAHSHSHEHCEENHIHEHLHDQGQTHHHEHHHHGHTHHSMQDVEAIIDSFNGVTDTVKENIKAVYKIIAEAESKSHGRPVSEIHFHEVGMMDAIMDVTAVCILMDMIRPDAVTASPVRVGYGHMRCAHGILPVPAPATANIMMGIPTYAGNIEAELCTPTGAALLRHFAAEFGEQPLMQTEKIGYGMGTKDFEVCNCVRALLGK